jgi:hypothetical protein
MIVLLSFVSFTAGLGVGVFGLIWFTQLSINTDSKYRQRLRHHIDQAERETSGDVHGHGITP